MAAIMASLLLGLTACSEKEEEFTTEPLSDYTLQTPGKYIIYRLDSTVTTNFGVSLVTRSYQMKHEVDAAITDNLGRPSVRVYRSIRNADGTGEWIPRGSYLVTNTGDQVEVVEDNLRFIKLHAPMREGFEWKGNSYLPEYPYSGQGFNIAVVDYMKNWEYYYETFEPEVTINGQVYNDVYTVQEEDFTDNWPVSANTAGVNITASEKYARNIGMVYRSHTILEYDPNTSGSTPTYNGFAVRMWMVAHN